MAIQFGSTFIVALLPAEGQKSNHVQELRAEIEGCPYVTWYSTTQPDIIVIGTPGPETDRQIIPRLNAYPDNPFNVYYQMAEEPDFGKAELNHQQVIEKINKGRLNPLLELLRSNLYEAA